MSSNKPSCPEIPVGGDFKTGDINTGDIALGQYAVGKGITQTIEYNDCTFVLSDSSVVHGRSWIYIEGIRPSTDPATTFGRQENLKKLDEYFKQHSAVAVTGLRATGKSTLASMYIDRLEKEEKYAGIYWRRVDDTTDIRDVVGSFFTVIGKPIKYLAQYKVDDLINLLFRELKIAPYFLVLDNFETLLDPETNKPLSSKLGFSDLIEKIKEGGGRSRIMFTSWECPASERGIRPKCYFIGGLDEPAAIQLLRKGGLTEPDNDLKKVIYLSGGHPLALILLLQLIDEGFKTLSDVLADTTLWVGAKGEVAERILNKVYEERLNDEERELLQYVSLYREPVPLQTIIVVASDPIRTEAEVEQIALRLFRKSLLQKRGGNYWEESLIKNYAYGKLTDKIKWHKIAFQYYLSLPLQEKRTNIVDVQPLIEAYHHACMAEEYDKAASIIFDHNLYEDLDRWGKYTILVELYTGILPKDPINDKPLLGNKKMHSGVIGNLGLAYSDLGQFEKAIEYSKQALKFSGEISDKYREGIWIGNLGLAYYQLGQIEESIEYHKQELEITKKIGDRCGEGNALGNIGLAYSAQEKPEKAIEYYTQTLYISIEICDRRSEGNALGNIGLAHRDLGDVEKAIEYYNQALEIFRETSYIRGEGNALGSLGLAYYQLGQVEEAIEYHENALKIAREIGDRRNEGICLGSLGLAYSVLEQTKKAIEYHENALKIAREIGDRRNEGIWLENLGLVYHEQGQIEEAIEYYNQALVIGNEIKDPRIISFCEKWLSSINH